ncbi:MAG: phosphoribosylanthranilate isomerase, partial [Blastocatellia bacterium]|nr:phosphoribosylanthranilate isomerase [Blastocatellia bacterium]
MTRVKICGITTVNDALSAAEIGADELGFNFYSLSPRHISADAAAEITRQLPSHIQKIGVFVNASINDIAHIATTAKLDAVQLHGDETPGYIEKLRRLTECGVIKSLRVSGSLNVEDILAFCADAILLDAYSPAARGGTGETFDWDLAANLCGVIPKLYLAGGLSPENVPDAIRKVRPFAVDVCSGVESSPGNKDAAKIKDFIESARSV